MASNVRKQYARMSAKFRYDLKQLEIRINESNKFYEKDIQRANRSIERFKGKYPALSSPFGKYLTDEDMERAIAEMQQARFEGAISKRSRVRSEANLQDYLERQDVPLSDNQMKKLYDFLDYMREKKLVDMLNIGSGDLVEVGSRMVRGHFSKEMVIKNIESWIKESANVDDSSGKPKPFRPTLRRKFPNSSNNSF